MFISHIFVDAEILSPRIITEYLLKQLPLYKYLENNSHSMDTCSCSCKQIYSHRSAFVISVDIQYMQFKIKTKKYPVRKFRIITLFWEMFTCKKYLILI